MFIKQKLYKQFTNKSINNNDLTKYIIENNARLGDELKKYGSNAFFTGAGSTIITIKE
jgi:4-diphosphocytidyl-2C-methyl-D-erythritol kinase